MTIYDNYLHINTVKAFCADIAERNNYAMYDYFWDNHTETKFPGNSDIYSFKVLEEYDIWQIKFKLSKFKTVRHVGLDEYVNKYRELVFHLTIKGHQFLYVCVFNPAPPKQDVVVKHIGPVLYDWSNTNGQLCLFPEPIDYSDIYKEEESPDYGFFYQDDPFLSK